MLTKKIFFAQNVMPKPVDPPDPDPGEAIINPCAIDTQVHPRWNDGGHNVWGEDWFRADSAGEIGFAALPGGYRWSSGSFGSLGAIGYWWSSTEHSSALAWSRFMLHSYGDVARSRSNKASGFSLRCVRNATQTEIDNDVDGEVYVDDYEDGDGNTYDGVKIGNQIWTKTNLKTTHYQSGLVAINTGLSDSDWENTTDGAYAIYPHSLVSGIDSDAEMIAAYGLLYNWYAIDGLVDDNGYRVPTDDDWTQLTDYLKDEYSANGIDSSNVALPLKSCRQVNHPEA